MIVLRLIFAAILGLLYVIIMMLVILVTAIFAPKTFNELFKQPIE